MIVSTTGKYNHVNKFMSIARAFAMTDTPCLRTGCAAIIVDPETWEPVSMGYNGPPSGTPHPNTYQYVNEYLWPKLSGIEKHCWQYNTETLHTFIKSNKCCPRHVEYILPRDELCSCVHAEANALLKARCSVANHVMYSWSRAPCEECAKLIVNAKLHTVFCNYRVDLKHPGALWLLEQGNVELIELEVELNADGLVKETEVILR